MNNTKVLLSRMKSIRQTVKISSAQKLIASSRINRARRMLEADRPFHERVRQAIAEILALRPEAISAFLEKPGANYSKRGLLIISADRGLAGGYNGNVIKLAQQTIAENVPAHIIVLGKVGRVRLSALHIQYDAELPLPMDVPRMYSAREIAEKLIELFESGEVDCFDVIYTHFISAVRMYPRMERLFPLSPQLFREHGALRSDVEFEPSPEALLQVLISKYLKGFLYGCLVHAWTSELTSRITAMDNAIRNGNEMLDKLQLVYNRARQANITQEITEIVAGASYMGEE